MSRFRAKQGRGSDAPNATRAEFLAFAKSNGAIDMMMPAESDGWQSASARLRQGGFRRRTQDCRRCAIGIQGRMNAKSSLEKRRVRTQLRLLAQPSYAIGGGVRACLRRCPRAEQSGRCDRPHPQGYR